LTKVLTYHVVAGKWDAAAIAKLIKDGGGSATLKTVAGGTLKAWMKGNKLILDRRKRWYRLPLPSKMFTKAMA
jgi:uncharacterized surface protein with fasciclin (FAS1) repeats